MAKHILKILEDVVNSMRTVGTINNITDNLDGTYTITVSNVSGEKSIFNLSNNDYITISDTQNFNGSYKISNLTSNSFDITKATGYAISTLGFYASNKPFYSFGTFLDGSREVSQKNLSAITKNQIYPLIWVLLNISEDRDNDIDNENNINNLKIFFITKTLVGKTREYELNNSYIGNLITIYELFMDKLKRNKRFNIEVGNLVPHDYQELFFAENEFNEIISAIQITINELKYKKKYNCLIT